MSYPLFDKFEAVTHIQEQCGETEKSKGFRGDWELADRLEELAGELSVKTPLFTDTALLDEAAAALRRNYVGTKLMLIVSEVAEMMETLRDTDVPGILNGEGNFAEEGADVLVRVLALNNMLGLDTATELSRKMNKNKDRPMMHGRKL